MTRRELLLTKMCEVYNESIEFYSQEYAMDKVLSIAERFAQTAQIDDPEPMSYAHRAMNNPDQSTINRLLPLIHTWLRHDTTLDLRKKITAEDCEKLAIRLAVLL